MASTDTDTTSLNPLPRPPAPVAPQAPPPPAFSQGVKNRLGSWGLSEDDISVQNRLQQVMDPDSPLMQMAVGQADQAFNRRGLINSSGAVQAGQQAIASKALEIVNPEIDRLVTMARTDRDNDAAMAREQAQVSGQVSIASMNNTAAAERDRFGADASQKLATLNNTAAFDRQSASDKNAWDRQAALLTANATQAADEIRGRKELSAQEIEGRRVQANTDFTNQVDLFNKGTERLLGTASAEAATQLQASYRGAAQATYDAYLRDVQAIQTAELDADAKKTSIDNLNTLYTQRQAYTNTLYAATPQWNKEWQQVGVSFGPPPPPQPSAPAPAATPAPSPPAPTAQVALPPGTQQRQSSSLAEL